ncbi:hypothetical protein L3X38_009940 [Prunus dulcis]|uniref:RNase H type-1 domain-containing protein n=1 Tax=Prunus dulcis TaxID=3755 RepID=A0AAD4WEH3_PRUDU|nr:hypothetical protein L3X38_009940 [Prunus dulcis]
MTSSNLTNTWNDKFKLEEILCRVKNYDVEYKADILDRHRKVSLPSNVVRCQQPQTGYFKLNVNVAVDLNDGSRGVGIIVRDSDGDLAGAVAMAAPSMLSVLVS